MVAARYVRELHLMRDDLGEAADDFLDVVRLKPAHWGGHFPTHIAGLTQDPSCSTSLDGGHSARLRSREGDRIRTGVARRTRICACLRRSSCSMGMR